MYLLANMCMHVHGISVAAWVYKCMWVWVQVHAYVVVCMCMYEMCIWMCVDVLECKFVVAIC